MAPFSWSRWLRSLFRPQVIRTIRKRLHHALSVEGLETRLAPATFTWTGLGGTSNWSLGANWQGGIAPTGSATTLDDLVFPTGVVKVTAKNDITGGTFGSITIASGKYDLTGNGLTLNPSPTDTASVIVNAGASGAKFDFTGALTLANVTQFFDIGAGASLTINSQLSGDSGASLSKEQGGTLVLNHDNSTFSGSITVDTFGGVLQIENPKALGNNAFATTVQQNGQLQVNLAKGASAVAENLVLNGFGLANDGALLNVGATGATWIGSIELDSDVSFGNSQLNTVFPPAAPDAALALDGVITDLGAGHNVTKVGVGEVIFGAANDYRGNTTIQNGILDVQNPLALGPGDGTNLTGVTVNQKVAEDGTVLSSGTLRLDFTGNLSPTDPNAILAHPGQPYDAKANPIIGFQVPNKLLVLNGAGLNGKAEAAIGAIDNGTGSNTWSGNVILGSLPPDGQAPSVGAESFDPYYPLTLSGVLSSPNGNYQLTKVGAGIVILTNGTNSYTGATLVAAGTLEITDSSALGNTPRATVSVGASLELSVKGKTTDSVTGVANMLNVSVPLFISGPGAQGQGALFSASGINTYSGTVTLQDDPSYPNDNDDPPFGGAADLDDEAAIGVSAVPNMTAGPGYLTNDYSLTITGDLVSKAQVVNDTITTPAIKLIKTLAGQLILPNANPNFQGNVDIEAGWITVENSNSLGGHIDGLGDTEQPTITVGSGAALHLDAPGGSINIGQNLNLTGIGFIHSYGLINQMGAVENIAGTNTLSGNVGLNGPVGIGVENIFGASDLTLTGTLGSQAAQSAIAVNATASGGSAENDNVIDTGATSGTVTVNYQMYTIPDPLDIYYGDYSPGNPNNAVNIANTGGPVSGSGTLTANYAPIGAFNSTDITIVMDQGGGLSGTAWTYTATIVPNVNSVSAGGIVKLGSQKLNIQGPGTYTGAVDIQAGVLRDQNDTGLGSGASSTTVEAGQATIQRVALLDATPGTTQMQLTLTMPNGMSASTGSIPFMGSPGTGLTPDAQAIQDALNSLPTIQALSPSGGVTVTQLATGLWNVTFGGAMTSFDEQLSASVSGTGLESISTTLEQHGAGAALELGLTTPGEAGGISRGVQVTGEHLILNGQGDPAFNDAPLTAVANSDQMWRGPVTLNNNVNIQIPSTSRISLEGVIDDAKVKSPSGAGFTMTQGGELDLGGSNTYRGTTYVNNGVLTVQNAQALGGTGVADIQTITVSNALNPGTTFGLVFGSATTAAITYNGVSTGAGSDASAIQSALQAALTAAGIQGTVTVTEKVGATTTVFTVTFGGALVGFDQPQLQFDPADMPPDPTQFALATTQHGAGGTMVASGAALRTEGNLTIAGEPLIVQGQGVASSPNVPLQWFNVGPAPEQGGQTAGNGNVSGRVTGEAVDPSDPNVIYISTAGGGAWKTINGGQTWEPIFDATYALFGGAIAVAPSDPRVIYFGTGEADNSLDSYAGTGVYMSSDSGRTWTLLTGPSASNPMNATAVSSIVVDPGNANTIFVANSDLATNGEAQQHIASTVGVWRYMNGKWVNLTDVTSPDRSTAGGVTGAPGTPGPDDDFRLAFPQSDATWSDLALVGSSSTNNLILYAALGTAFGNLGANAVYRCEQTNGLLTNTPSWYIGDDTKANGQSSKEFPTNLVTGGLPTEGNIKITAFISNSPVPYILLPAPAFNPDTAPGTAAVTLYASIENPQTLGLWKIEKSTDGGVTWAEVAAEPITNAGQTYLGGQGWYDSTIVSPDGVHVFVGGVEDYAAGGALQVQESTNGGTSWTDISIDSNGNGPHTDDHAMAIDSAGNLDLGSDGGVWQFNTAKNTWTDINGNLATLTLNGVATDPNNPNIILAASQDNGTSLTQTGVGGWSLVDFGDGGQVGINPANPNIMYHVENGSLNQSTTGGTLGSWKLIYTALPRGGLYFPFALDQVNTSRLLVGGDALVESLDNGATFTSLGSPFVATGGQTTAIALATYQGAFTADPRFPTVTDQGANTYDPDTIYIFGTDGDGTRHLYVTKNGGTTWVDRTAGLPVTTILGDSLTVDPRNRDTAYLVDSSPAGSGTGRVWETTDGGQSWTDISKVNQTNGLPDVPTWTIVVDPRTGYLYVGNDEGVYESTDGGSSWVPFGAGLPSVQVKALDLNQNLNVLTAATYGRSAYQITLADIPANSGAISAGSGTSVWTGQVQLAGATAIGAYGTPAGPSGIVGPQLNIVGTISDLILGTQSNTLTKVGPGNVILSGANTYSGLTDVQSGSLIVHNPNALGANPSTPGNPGLGTVVELGAALKLQSSVLGEPLTLEGNGPTSLELNQHSTGALENASGNNTYSGNITLQSSSTIGVDSGSSLTVTGIIGGAGASYGVTKQLSGTLILDNENTYSGGTTVDQGIVSIQSPHGLGADGTNTIVLNGAQLQVQGGIDVPDETLTLSGTGISGTGALEGVGGANSWDGAITLAQDTPPEDPPSSPSANAPANIGIGVLFTNPSDSLTLTGTIGQATPFLGINKVDAGTLILDNDQNTYSGATIVSQGALRVQQSGALGTPGSSSQQGIIVSGAGGTFTLTYNGQTTAALSSGATAGQVQSALNALTSIKGIGGTVSVTQSGNVYTINFGGTLGGGNPLPLSANGTGGTVVRVASNGTFVVPGGAIEIDGDPTGVGASLTVSGEGLTLSGNGAPEVQQVTVLATAGTFTLSFGGKSTSALGFNTTAAQVQTALNGLTSIGGVGGSVTVIQTPVAGGSVYTVIFNGSLASAHQALLGASLSGAPVGSSINVIIARDGGTGALDNITGDNAWTGPVVLQSATTVGVDPGTVITVSGVVEDPAVAPVPAASLTKVGAGELVFPGVDLYTGKTIVNNGILDIQSSSTTGGTPLASPLGAVVSQIDSVNVAGPITGTFTLTFNGKTTGTMGVTASAAQVQGQLSALSTIGAGNVAVTKSGSTFTITFQGALGGSIQPPLSGTGSNGAIVTVTAIQNGSDRTVVNPGGTLLLDSGITMSTTALTLNGTGASEVQQVILSDTTPGDDFTLSFNGQLTVPLDPNAGAPAVQAALNAIAGVGGSFSVVQTPMQGFIAYTVAFGGNLAGAAQTLLGADQPNAGIAPTVNELQVGGIGALDSINGGNTWDTPITLAGNTAIGTEASGNLTIDQAIGLASGQSAVTLTKVGPGTALLSGSSSNTYGGLTSVNGGTLQLGKTGGALAVPADLTIGNNTAAPGSDMAQLEGNSQLPSTANVTVNSDGVFDLNGNLQTIGTLNMTGGTVELTDPTSVLTVNGNITATSDAAGNPANINNAGTLVLASADPTITVNGPAFAPPAVADMVIATPIVATGITKAGGGTLQLTSANPGLNATINAGGVLADATNDYTLNAVTLDTLNANAPALLGGNGLVADIIQESASAGGTIQPGDGPTLPGTLTSIPVSGADTLTNASNLSLVLNDINDFSQLAVSGDINLGGIGSPTPSQAGGGGATLSGFIGPGVNIGDTYTILTTTGTVNGRFNEPYGETTDGLGIAFIGGQKFTVDYSDPQAVVLTAVTQNASVTLTPSVANTATAPVFGQDVTWTATVTPEPGAGPIPNNRDTVTFTLDNNPLLSENVLVTNGQATYDPATFSGIPLGVGPHTITAVFNGDGIFNASDPASVTETVKQASASIGVSALPANPVPGEAISVTATITPLKPGAGVPSGTATFFVDGSSKGTTVNLSPNGQASVTLTFPSVSVHSVKVSYSGDTNFKGISTSTSTAIKVVKGNPQVGVSATPLTSSYGQAVLFQVDMTGQGGVIPTGTVVFYNGSASQANTLGTQQLDISGQASISVSNLHAGQHTITVVYGGNISFNGATGALINFVVSQASTQTTLSVAPTTVAYGRAVTMTANVAITGSGVGSPTGNVIFYDGGTALTKGKLLNQNGVATFITSAPLGVGTHQITAAFQGSNDFAASAISNVVDVTVQVGTNLIVTSSANPSVYGQAINLTATLKPQTSANIAAASGETVTFFDGPANLGTANLNSSGVAVLPGITLAVDVGNVPHAITVVYSGDSTFLGSTGILKQIVNRSPTKTTLTSSAQTSLYGAPITFTVTVAASGNGVGIPTGTVNFYDGTAIPAHMLGNNTLDITSGVTTFSPSTNLNFGLHVITAVYAGDANFAPSQTTLNETITAASTTTTVTDADPSLTGTPQESDLVFSQLTTLTATVTSGSGIPGGKVTFFDGTQAIGTQTLDNTGTAILPTATLPVGADVITAKYLGSSNFAVSSSGTVGDWTVSVSQDTVTPTISASANPVAQNTLVTFSATITSDAPGTATPTGTVSFYDDTSALTPGTGTLLNATAAQLKATSTPGVAIATFSTSSLGFGTHTIDAGYNGSAGFFSSTAEGGLNFATTTETVLFGDTVTISASPSSTIYGNAVNMMATITPIGGGGATPGGTVTFYDGPVANGNAISPPELVSFNGSVTTASFSTSGLTAGTHNIFAAYSGDSVNFIPNNSATSAKVVVAKSTTLTTIAQPSNATPVYGTTVSITAVVSAISGIGTPSGFVTFFDGSKALSPQVQVDNTGTAVLQISTLTAGSKHNISAKYTGDTNFQASAQTGTVAVTPSKAASAIVLTSSVDTGSGGGSSVYSQPITFTAVLSNASVPGGGNFPSGKITFLLDGTTVLGGAAVTINSSGVATVTVSNLTVDTATLPFHTITASYAGDVNYTGISTGSAGADQIAVSQDMTDISVTSSVQPSFFNQTIVLSATAKAAAPGTGVPAGEFVTFYDGSIDPGHIIGTGKVNATGVATLTLSTLSVGTHQIFASYAGDANYIGGQTSTGFTQTVVAQTVTHFSGVPTTKTVGPATPFSFKVTALDANGNQVIADEAAVSITLVSGPGTLTGIANGQFVNGVFTFTNLKASKAGSYQIRITANGISTTVTLVVSSGSRFT